VPLCAWPSKGVIHLSDEPDNCGRNEKKLKQGVFMGFVIGVLVVVILVIVIMRLT
jgi:hypothetical protein